MKSVIAVAAPGTFAADRLVYDYDVDRESIVELDADQAELPNLTSGLLIYAPNDHPSEIDASGVVRVALEAEIPILGSAAGMHRLNVALGGDVARKTPDHVADETKRRNRSSIFLAPGAKVSSTIGGSGWLSLECDHQEGIRQPDLAPGMMPAAMSDDRVVEAFEMPGFHWVFGVQWDVFGATRLPRGFDNVLVAFIERAMGN